MHPSLLGHELLRLIVEAKAAGVAALLETRDGENRDAVVWVGCEVDRARALTDEPGVVHIPLGTGHGRTCEIAAVPPAAPSARATLLAIERLAHAALELHRSREREREQAALWPEQTVEQQLGMVFASETMVELVKTTRRVATANVTVLITGETGTGKELLARALHQSSPRREHPFVPFNCTAVARDMIDAQLFGYRRGAFTGAHEAFPGVIRAAAEGTLFLDEIGEIGLEVQPKLLRFLESGEVHPLGEARPTDVDVRIVAATNANLERLVAEGRFREDLFYRLDVVRLHIPPLRERREEIPLLVEHFLLKYSQESKKVGLRVPEETMEYLVLYRWPGNARQLANEMHRLVALAESGAVLMPEHLSREIATSRKTVPASERDLAPTELVVRIDQPMSAAAEHLERAMIQHAMLKTDGRVEDAARMLGVSRKGLYLKRQRFGIE
jgi:DNA-binding NtrC family response regulator